MEVSFFKHELFLWGIGLVLGLPILILVLGEIQGRLERWGNPLAQAVGRIRHIVLPALVILLIMRHLLSIADAEFSARVVQTLFWLTVIYAVLTLVRNLIEFGEVNPSSWIAHVPTLFIALARGAALFMVLSHILAGIWGFDLKQIGPVVGVSSLAIGLALQSTISGLVSGFMMLADRPFKPGDWIEVGGMWMEVQEVNWRTTRLRNFGGWGLVLIPNGSLAGQTIINYGQEGSLYEYMAFVTFSYDDPPDVVKRVLTEALDGIDGVLSPPSVVVVKYEDFGIQYRLYFHIEFFHYISAQDAIYTRVYYAAKRNGLTLARPIEFQGNLEELKPKIVLQRIVDMIRSTTLFEALDAAVIERLASGTSVQDFAEGEVIVHQGKPDEGFYVMQTGEVALSVRDQTGQVFDFAHLKTGEFFGEMALLRNEPSPISATATSAVRLLVVRGALITQLIDTNPQFAQEMNFFIEKRQTLVNAISGSENGK